MKQKAETVRTIIATIFMSVNQNQRQQGTGMTFKYKNKPYKNEDNGEEGWLFDLILDEAGHGTRTLQSFPFKKTNGMDRYTMEYNVLMSVLAIFAETTLLQWNELGKMLNTDKDLQKAAKETLIK